MADAKISALPAVVTPAAADEFAVNQGGTSKKQTRAQIHILEATEHLSLPQVNEPLTPTLTFGDGDSGFYESADDTLRLSLGGIDQWAFQLLNLISLAGSGPKLAGETATVTNPTLIPNQGNDNSGIGGDAVATSIISSGVEILRARNGGTAATRQLTIGPAGIIGAAATPALAFGDGDTGFFEGTDDNLFVAFAGIESWKWTGLEFKGSGATGVPSMINEVSSATNPVWSFQADADTGLGRAAADQLSLIAGSVQIAQAKQVAGANQFIIAPGVIQNAPATPSLAFGDGDSGFFESADDNLIVSIAATDRFFWSGDVYGGLNGTSAGLRNEAASAINPTVNANRSDADTGLGSATADQLNLIAGGLTCMSISETAGARQIGFYESSPISLQTGVAVTTSAVHAALVSLGLITA